MGGYHSVKANSLDPKLDKLKSATKNATGVILKLSSNIVGNDQNYFPHSLFLINGQVVDLCRAFANRLSKSKKLSKTQLSRVKKLGGILGRLLGSLMKAKLPLIKNVLKLLAKSVLLQLGLTATALPTHVEIHKKILGIGASRTATLLRSNEEMWDIMKIIKSLKFSSLLMKGVTQTNENETREQSGGFRDQSWWWSTQS